MALPDRQSGNFEQADLSPAAMRHVEGNDAEPKFRAILGRGGTRRAFGWKASIGTVWPGSLAVRASRWVTLSTRRQPQVGENGNLASMLRVVAFRWMWGVGWR